MAASSWKRFFPNGRGLMDGAKLNRLFEGVQAAAAFAVTGALTAGSMAVAGALSAVGLTFGGALVATPVLVTAAGTTQSTATALTAYNNIITVAATASTHGVKLPTASTGLRVSVANLGAFGVKVYPATNGKIGAAATNAPDATVLAINKVNEYVAQNTTRWAVQRGA